ncbi:MAG: class I SAM-dependent methyltransferase [Novosphingobium sp.]|nr:class I SAM-dependent methyltransferase [Novosphingobium sp.]
MTVAERPQNNTIGFGPDGRDELLLAAPEAFSIAHDHCSPECLHIHAIWGYLRLYGGLESVARDGDFLIRELRQAIVDGARRILIAGSADCGILSYVRYAAPEPAMLEIDLIDRCATPGALNRWYAKRHGLNLWADATDVMDFDGSRGTYDVILAHNFLMFFNHEGRCAVARKWASLLAPGGRILSVSTLSAGDDRAVTRFDRDCGEAIADKVAREHAAAAPDGIATEAIARLARSYAVGQHNYKIPSDTVLAAPFKAAGLDVTLRATGPFAARRGVVAKHPMQKRKEAN